MSQHRLLDSVPILQKLRFCFYCLEIFQDTTAYVIEIKWTVVFLIFSLCFCLNLSQFSCCCNVLIPRKWCKRKQPCFPVLCHTQISNTAANFKAKEGRKRDRKVSSIANTVEESEKRLMEKLQTSVDVLEVSVELISVNVGIMAVNDTHPLMEILKSFNLGECLLICLWQRTVFKRYDKQSACYVFFKINLGEIFNFLTEFCFNYYI